MAHKILPVYGEGNREAVEGVPSLHNAGENAHPPSVTPSARHLPVNGEDFH